MYVFTNRYKITATNLGIAEYFERDSSELAGVFAKWDRLVSIHEKDSGGITPVAEEIEIQWKDITSLGQLASESEGYQHYTLYRYFHQNKRTSHPTMSSFQCT